MITPVTPTGLCLPSAVPQAAQKALGPLLGLDHRQQAASKARVPHAPVLTGTRTELVPLGPDNGKVVYFLRHAGDRLRHRAADWIDGKGRWQEEIQQARKKGYTVVVDLETTRQDMQQALYDPRTAGVIFNGHGGAGYAGLKGPSPDFDKFFADQVDPTKVSRQLKLVVFQTCRTVATRDSWQRVLGNAHLIGWEGYVSLAKVAAANDPQLLDRLGIDGSQDHQDKRLDHLIDRFL